MRVLITGGRDFTSRVAVFSTLDFLHGIHGFTEGYHGACRYGVDRLADEWFKERGVPCKRMAADWENNGKSAGPIRNQKMLKQFRPDVVIAFPGERSSGTYHMMQISKKAGVPVITYSDTILRPWTVCKGGEILADYYKGKEVA